MLVLGACAVVAFGRQIVGAFKAVARWVVGGINAAYSAVERAIAWVLGLFRRGTKP